MKYVRALHWMALLLALQVPAAQAEGQLILSVDAEYLGTAMPLYTRVATAAARDAEGADAQRQAALELARDQRLSDILTAVPEAIAALAQAAGADLVIDRALARRLGEASARDITDEVEQALAQRFDDLPLENSP